jgi:hypothetical protein
VRWLPPEPALTPENARELLRTCAVVMRPGETLVIRAPLWWSPEQVSEYNTWLDGMTQDLPVRAIAVCGEDFALTSPAESGEDDPHPVA